MSNKNDIHILILSVIILLGSFFISWFDYLSALFNIILGVLVSKRFVEYLFHELRAEKLVLITASIFFAIMPLIGFILRFIGLKISNTSILIILASILIFQNIFIKTERLNVIFDKKASTILLLTFIAVLLVYLWPALPNLASPCTPGYDCSKHMDYTKSIYQKGEVIPPILEWRYYPFGTHLNSALLNKIVPFIPIGTFLYIFMVVIIALTITTLAAMLLGITNNTSYYFIFIVLVLTSIYPASSLIQFGFWAQIFGTYFVITGAWVLKDYIEKPNKKMIILYTALTMGSILAYNLVLTLSLILMFLIGTLIIKNRKKIINSAIYLGGIGIFFALYTLESLIRFFNYNNNLNLTWGNLQEFFSLGSQRMLMGGEILFANINYIGLMFIILSVVGLFSNIKGISSYRIFFLAIIFHMLLFYFGLKTNKISFYMYSKIIYLLIYPIILFSIIGFMVFIRKLFSFNNIKISYLILIIAIIFQSFALYNENSRDFLFGEKDFLYKTLDVNHNYWPMLEFNRYQRFVDLTEQKEHDNYGFIAWFKGYPID